MCKYCKDLGYDNDFDMFVDIINNKTAEICLVSEQRGHFLQVTNKINNDETSESITSVKIEYCPFCGQKLSDIKVENDNE